MFCCYAAGCAEGGAIRSPGLGTAHREPGVQRRVLGVHRKSGECTGVGEKENAPSGARDRDCRGQTIEEERGKLMV